MSTAEFVIAASIIIAVFALLAAQIEQYVNDLTDRLVHRGRARLAQRAAV